MKGKTLLAGILVLLVASTVQGADRVPLLNGPEMFSDSIGAPWITNNLMLTIDPGVVNNPFAQVGENFPNRRLGKDQLDSAGNRFFPENLKGIEFTVAFDPTEYLWQFSITSFLGDTQTGVVFVGNGVGEPIGTVQTGYIDSIVDPSGSDRHLRVTVKKPRKGVKVRLKLDHDFFRIADRYFLNFSLSPFLTSPTQPISFGFLNINWVTR